ncbi:hypothetical protein U1Q18_039373 [Sarracenia purpurea var. burkii]
MGSLLFPHTDRAIDLCLCIMIKHVILGLLEQRNGKINYVTVQRHVSHLDEDADERVSLHGWPRASLWSFPFN